MSTLIVYSTTYGFTADCVQLLAQQLNDDVKVVNIKTTTTIDLAQFDTVVIGGSIYIGQIQPELKAFCNNNLSILANKHVCLFLSCALVDNFKLNIENAFPASLINQAKVITHFGSAIRTDRLKFGHKLLTKMMQQALGDPTSINQTNDDKIKEMAIIINQLAKGEQK
jgi:menaquinone-dependent protoporphyrinogen oxidase